MTDLQNELYKEALNIKTQGKRNYAFATILYGTAAIASGAATVWTTALVSSKSVPNFWIAILAAVPGAAILINEALKPEAKARWCYEKRAALEGMLRRSKYLLVEDGELVKEWNELEMMMEREWPSFGAVSTKTTRQNGSSIK